MVQEENAVEGRLKLVRLYLGPEVTKRGRFEATGNDEEPHLSALLPIRGHVGLFAPNYLLESEGVRVGTNAARTGVQEFFETFIRRSILSDATSCGNDRHARWWR